MKKIIFVAGLCLALSGQSMAEGETKKVCVDVKDKAGKVVNDAKTGKPKQSCKEMKVHKKLEGTKVPEKK
jgi:hypothetical protein